MCIALKVESLAALQEVQNSVNGCVESSGSDEEIPPKRLHLSLSTASGRTQLGYGVTSCFCIYLLSRYFV